MEAKIIITTFSSEEEGGEVITRLVEKGLIGCGTMIPKVTSIYRWQGKVEKQSECLALLKTTSVRIEEAKGELLKLHPYQVPELIVVSPSDIHGGYLEWLLKETTVE